VGREELARQLAEDLGYDHEAVCEQPGEFAVRGNLLDLYPVQAEAPVRIDFFGDEIEALRTYDPATQRTTGSLASVRLHPAQSATGISPTGSGRASLAEYLDFPCGWIFEEPEQLRDEHPGFFEQPERAGREESSLRPLFERPASPADHALTLSETPGALPQARKEEVREEDTRDVAALREPEPATGGTGALATIGEARLSRQEEARRALLRQALEEQQRGTTVTLVLPAEQEEARLREWWDEQPELAGLSVSWIRGELPRGVWLPRAAPPRLLLTDAELFGREQRPLTGTRSTRALPTHSGIDDSLDFAELVEGDLLVHLSHGICRYRGIAEVEVEGERREIIRLEFADEIQLQLPVTEAHLLTRYVGLRKGKPRLGKPGSGAWERARQSAESSTLDLAARLLQLQARRMSSPGHAFAPDQPWQYDLEASFPHPETPDQLAALRQIKADMEAPRPMDRLLCGDVGFGKTEVALRAVFKAVLDGKQVAVLVPTTVLCQQHFQTFRERFAPFPVRVESLNRLRSARDQTEIRKQLREGGIDVVVGTHSLLSRSVRFRDLGLLVIDEEHRFGVRQKERLKEFRAEVDVLSMSATPIPRSLYLALSGARELSVIETPPRDRRPVETLVRPYSEEIIRSAIDYEIGRGGQVFYLHNRIDTLPAVEKKLRELFPRLRIGVGHGQMEGEELERTMTDFVAGRHDLLLCTTIIESGLDIPNCNTLLIEGADRFGLSQLYQIRGRVGRFNRQAYAYLLLHRHGGVLDSARKRLSAIRQHRQLGAGYRIALRDLELRGAGNLIGSEQSGEIAGVGFDLYCQLLRQSVARLKGEEVASHVRAEVQLDFVRKGTGARAENGRRRDGYGALRELEQAPGRLPPVPAELPADYLPEARLRLELYRRLGMAATREEVDRIGEELKDRFGPPPPPAKRLLELSRIRVEAEHRGIDRVESEGPILRLRRAGTADQYWKQGSRFPRLTAGNADRRLTEIRRILARL
jgi:transcription-repair coupling factor (superfamily II helicase)